MTDLVQALTSLAHQRGRGDAEPLLLVRALAERPGTRISHLPISQQLAQAWITLTGQPFRQHQSLSLSALRRGEPFALIGGGPAARQTLHLLACELLHGEPGATALLLAPDEDRVILHLGELERLSKGITPPLRVAAASGISLRAAMGARLVVASPTALHERLLHHHDRAWRAFWSGLRLIMIADADHYSGVAGGHLAALLTRSQRLAPPGATLQLAAGVGEVSGVDLALAQISGTAWRLIPLDDVPRTAHTIALWRSGGERLREAQFLALGLQRAGAGVHLTCLPYEVPALQALFGSEMAAISVAPSVLPAHVQILTGAGLGADMLRTAVESGALLTVLLLGEDPAERTLARLAAQGEQRLPLLDDPPMPWIVPPLNAYVAAQHLICAASEEPISAAEVEAWQYESIVDRLEDHGQLIRLPEARPFWQPAPGGDDPYAGFDLHAAGAATAHICDDQGAALGNLDPAAFDRWAFAGATLPPLRGGLRVIGRDEQSLRVTVRAGGEARRAIPLRRCTVRVRDTRERRSLRGREVAWGRVLVDEEIYGYREQSGANAPAERALATPLTTGWGAPGLWVDLPLSVQATGQLIGWSLAAALPLRTLAVLSDCVPVFDVEARRLFFVDAQPGGNGLAGWLYEHLEALLPLAYDIARDCRSDPLLEPLARADMDWLLALLGGQADAGARGRGDAGSRGPGERVPPLPQEVPAGLPLAAPPSPTPAVRTPSAPQPAAPPIRTPVPLPQPPLREPAVPPVKPAVPPAHDPSVPPAAPPSREPPRPRDAGPERASPRREPPPPRRDAGPERASPRREPPPPREPAQPPLPGIDRAPPREPSPPKRARPSAGGPREPASPRYKPRPTGRTPGGRDPQAGRQAADSRRPTTDHGEPGRGPAAPPRPRGAEPGRGPAAPPREPPPAHREPPPPHEPPAEPLPDAAAIAARLKRIREQRERNEQREQRELAPPPQRRAGAEGAEPRFRPGQRVACSPYGQGEVLASAIEDDRELLRVRFDEHGTLTVDAAVSAARLVDGGAADEEDPGF